MTDKTSKTPTESSLRNPLAALASVNEELAKEAPNALNRAHRRKYAQKARDLARKEPPPDHASALSTSELKREIGTRLEIVIEESDDPQGAMDELAETAERRGLIDSSNLPSRESPQAFVLDLWTDNPATLDRLNLQREYLPDPYEIENLPSTVDIIP